MLNFMIVNISDFNVKVKYKLLVQSSTKDNLQ